jgi:hypothetical protein
VVKGRYDDEETEVEEVVASKKLAVGTDKPRLDSGVNELKA